MEAYVVNGAAKTLLNFCDSLRDQQSAQVQIAIATFYRGKVGLQDTPNEFVSAVRERGIEAFVIAERSALDFGVIPAMRRVAREFAPDIIETNNVKSHFLVRLAGLHKGRHWLAVHHGYTATDSKVKFLNMLDRLSLPAADRVVLVCGAFREQLNANKVRPREISVVHNSAAVISQLPETDSLRARYRLSKHTKVLVTIGRLSFEKGHADLLRALGIVHATRPELAWKLMIVGSGPEQPRLQQLAAQMSLTDRVIFTGQQSDVLSFLAIADAMVLPSHTEGSPHVVLEAMAAGTPILATRVGGVPEILSDDIARLVSPRDEKAMAEAVLSLLENGVDARERSAKAQHVLEQRFSHEAYRDNMLQLFEAMQRRST
jgi:glycosyltransferase involved in cell wall biosynthesis